MKSTRRNLKVAALTPKIPKLSRDRAPAGLSVWIGNAACAGNSAASRHSNSSWLAWSVEADVWTTDRDFAGTGVATWSTPNLMRGFAEAKATH